MTDLSIWLTLKSYIDGHNIVNIVDFENMLISCEDIDIEISLKLAKNHQHIYTRAINYINSRRSEHVKNIYLSSIDDDETQKGE